VTNKQVTNKQTTTISERDRAAIRRGLEKSGHFSSQQVTEFVSAIVAELYPDELNPPPPGDEDAE